MSIESSHGVWRLHGRPFGNKTTCLQSLFMHPCNFGLRLCSREGQDMKLLKKGKLYRIGEGVSRQNWRGPSDRLGESHGLPASHV